MHFEISFVIIKAFTAVRSKGTKNNMIDCDGMIPFPPFFPYNFQTEPLQPAYGKIKSILFGSINICFDHCRVYLDEFLL